MFCRTFEKIYSLTDYFKSLFKLNGGKIMKCSFPKNQKIGKIEQCFFTDGVTHYVF